MNITTTPLSTPPATIEIVERKGLGHPDTLCDALAEQFSVALSRFYLDHFGFILHIGRPIQEPQIADLHVRMKEGCALGEVRTYIAEIAQAHLSAINTLWRDLLAGEQKVF